jgi:hypothetical protein
MCVCRDYAMRRSCDEEPTDLALWDVSILYTWETQTQP